MEINYPPLAFAFNPVIVEITGLTEAVQINAGGISLRREPKDGKATFDLQAIARTLFDRKQFNNIPVNSPDTVLKKNLTFTVSGNPEQYTIPVIWGAMQIGETWSQTKTLTWFKNFPFTVPLYLPNANTVRRRHDKNPYINYITNLPAGKYSLSVGNLDAHVKVVFRIDADGEYESGLFDLKFDYTFRPITKNTILITLLINECTDGIYLRWINKHGEYCYYLFERGVTSGEVKNTSVDISEFPTTINYTNGYHPGSNHPQGKEVQQSIRLFAPLVDANTFAHLCSLAESPVVDLFGGYDENNLAQWTGVNIAPATFARDNTPLQDFECTLLLPKTFTQSL